MLRSRVLGRRHEGDVRGFHDGEPAGGHAALAALTSYDACTGLVCTDRRDGCTGGGKSSYGILRTFRSDSFATARSVPIALRAVASPCTAAYRVPEPWADRLPEVAGTAEQDDGAGFLRCFGQQLKLLRDRAGLTRAELGSRQGYGETRSLRASSADASPSRS
jgi:hypothetical protein